MPNSPNYFVNMQVMKFISDHTLIPVGVGYFLKFSVGVSGTLLETLTLFQIKILIFPTLFQT